MNTPGVRAGIKLACWWAPGLAALAMFASALHGQLEISPENPNYLSYRGRTLVLFAANPDYCWHVEDYPLASIGRNRAALGANHIWVLLELHTRRPWSFTKNPGPAYYQKLRAIVAEAQRHDVIVGIILFGYNVYKYPHVSSFNRQGANECAGDCGPLDRGIGFFDLTSDDSAVVEAREVQKAIMGRVVEATWEFPNVYYCPGWELDLVRGPAKRDWFVWVRRFMETEGRRISPASRHLFALEMTMTPGIAADLGYDFVVEEDGNAGKTPGIPFVYLSMDAPFRGVKAAHHPREDLAFMRRELLRGAAGLATVWEADSAESAYLAGLARCCDAVGSWADEPGREISAARLPAVPDR